MIILLNGKYNMTNKGYVIIHKNKNNIKYSNSEK